MNTKDKRRFITTITLSILCILPIMGKEINAFYTLPDVEIIPLVNMQEDDIPCYNTTREFELASSMTTNKEQELFKTEDTCKAVIRYN